jgi:hypothetical protein
MYARFTDRARKVMQLANQEAQRFNHEYIGTEHILLGLVKEGSGVAANVLKNLDIDLRKVRMEVEMIVQTGPEMVFWGKLPQTPRAKMVLEYAVEEAHNLNHNYVGTEHLLLGLLREKEGVASQVLMNLLLDVDDIREAVLDNLGQPSLPTLPLDQARRREEADHQDRIRRLEDGLTAMVAHWPQTQEEQQAKWDEQHTQLRSLEQQLRNVRVLLGALLGAFAGGVLAAQSGALIGLLAGGAVGGLGRFIPALLAGCITGILLGSTHLPDAGGGLLGALMGVLAGVFLVEIGAPPGKRRRYGWPRCSSE